MSQSLQKGQSKLQPGNLCLISNILFCGTLFYPREQTHSSHKVAAIIQRDGRTRCAVMYTLKCDFTIEDSSE